MGSHTFGISGVRKFWYSRDLKIRSDSRPKVTKMRSIDDHSIDYNGVGVLRGQRQLTQVPLGLLWLHSVGLCLIVVLAHQICLVAYVLCVLKHPSLAINYRKSHKTDVNMNAIFVAFISILASVVFTSSKIYFYL